ncbi:two-component sensor histidine kinase [Bdellovibrio bacteriovorus]|uniref:histidine kinase n=1 Tax=Bdellovibrio bacteriovorus TaxID=959 RepID=A0A150WMH1_BDEBC|nr:HAMP domain-containing sensor histidine kinase [Bdellovibrio bacteriovorus]KYG65507.1 two-component sensor histidine kinase [Bdellovibrio bacteriovorus]
MFLKKIFSPLSSLSIRLRLAIIFVFIFGATTIVFNMFLFKAMIDTLQQDFDDALFNYSVDVSEGIEIGIKGDLSFPPLRLDHGKILPFPLGTALIQVRHSSGAVLARVGNFGDFNPPYKKDFERIWKGEEATYRTINKVSNIPSAEADSYRLISFPLDNAAKPQLLLQIAVPMTLLETQVRQRLTLLQIGIPLVLIIATFGGMFFSTRALKPLKNMIQTAKEIKATELSKRVPVPNAKDEIRELTLTMNDMLDRIEQSFQSQERFVADASHQLLTPLTIMRGELELLQKTEKKDIDGFIKSSLQEVDNLADIVQEMLLLSRVDAGIGALNLQDLALDEVVFETLPRAERLANSKGIKLKFDINNESGGDRKMIRGDNDLLQNLIFNIIENAIKYSPNNEIVTITLNWKAESSELVIQDNGPGINEDQLPYIFDRFSRGSKIETRVKGFGLGLAIAQKIAILHNTKIKAENRPGHGAQFSIEIKNI